MNEQDRLNANEYHYENYKQILMEINSSNADKAKEICRREMSIIDEDKK